MAGHRTGNMTSQITSLTIVYSTVYSRRRSKKTSKLRVAGLCAQKASNAENVSIWWRHHGHSVVMTWKQTGDSNPYIYIYIYIIVLKSVDCVCWGTRCFMHIRKLWWCGQNGYSHYICVLRRKALDCMKTSWCHLLCFNIIYQRTCLNKDMTFETIQYGYPWFAGFYMVRFSLILVLELYHNNTTIARHAIIYNLTFNNG